MCSDRVPHFDEHAQIQQLRVRRADRRCHRGAQRVHFVEALARGGIGTGSVELADQRAQEGSTFGIGAIGGVPLDHDLIEIDGHRVVVR
jgi:hypothetical protein